MEKARFGVSTREKLQVYNQNEAPSGVSIAANWAVNSSGFFCKTTFIDWDAASSANNRVILWLKVFEPLRFISCSEKSRLNWIILVNLTNPVCDPDINKGVQNLFFEAGFTETLVHCWWITNSKTLVQQQNILLPYLEYFPQFISSSDSAFLWHYIFSTTDNTQRDCSDYFFWKVAS